MEQLPTDSITPYPQNNRTHPAQQIERIAESIKAFGFNQPIVVDETNTVLVGHGRLLAAQLLGLDKVPVQQVSSLTAAQKRAYRILDNKLQNDSEWDYAMLEKEIAALQAEDFDLQKWGLDELLPEPEIEVAEDEGPGPLPEESYLKSGDLIELGAHRILCGDSTSQECLARLMNGAIMEMMFTDPPYGVSYRGGHFHSGDVNIKRETKPLSADDSTDIYPQFLNAALRHVDGPCYMWFAGSKARDVYNALAENRCEIHALIIWHKINATYAAMNAQYKQRHEPLLYFKPKNSTLRWIGPSDECTVWEEKRDARNDMHPTQKPVVLAGRAIKNHDANLIADFFLGSGSTLIACDKLKRVCYGMEIDPRYCQVIIERYQKHCEAEKKSFDCFINGKKLDGTTEAHLD